MESNEPKSDMAGGAATPQEPAVKQERPYSVKYEVRPGTTKSFGYAGVFPEATEETTFKNLIGAACEGPTSNRASGKAQRRIEKEIQKGSYNITIDGNVLDADERIANYLEDADPLDGYDKRLKPIVVAGVKSGGF